MWRYRPSNEEMCHPSDGIVTEDLYRSQTRGAETICISSNNISQYEVVEGAGGSGAGKATVGHRFGKSAGGDGCAGE